MTNESSPLSPEASPLTEADPNSLNEFIQRVAEIFNKPILEVSDQELLVAVEYYQKERARFKIESQQKEQRPKANGKGRKITSVADAIATEDLL
jgi:hypothetical protein